MKKYLNGKYVEITEAEQEEARKTAPVIPYKDRVINRIREKYSIDDEIAIIRQRDTKPLEFEEYNTFVEQVKAEEREVV